MPSRDSSAQAKNQIALITGASSGIGMATALELARAGLSTVLVARRAERLHALTDEIRAGGGQAWAIPADLSSEGARRRLYNQVRATWGSVDVLINNAGLGWYGYARDMTWNLAQQMLAVNVAAAVHLTLLFLPQMMARRHGHVINVGSISGSLPSQGIALYGATKSFLDHFTSALHRETRGSGVHFSVVRAGPVATEFYDRVAAQPGALRIPVERFAVPAETVARRIASLLRRPARVAHVPRWLGVVPWFEMTFGWLIDRVGPLLLRRQSSRGESAQRPGYRAADRGR